MPNLLKDTFTKTDQLRGKNLVITLLVTFIVFLFIGISVRYYINQRLNLYEIPTINSGTPTIVRKDTTKEGIVTFVDPHFNPGEDISFFLADTAGKEIILLKTDDQKLEVSEGLFVEVSGNLLKTNDGRDVLEVERISVK